MPCDGDVRRSHAEHVHESLLSALPGGGGGKAGSPALVIMHLFAGCRDRPASPAVCLSHLRRLQNLNESAERRETQNLSLFD